MTEVLQAIRELHADVRQLTHAVTDLSRRLAVPVAQPQIEALGSILNYLERHAGSVHRIKEQDHLYRAVRLRSRRASDLIDEFERGHSTDPALLPELRQRLVGLATADAAALGVFCAMLDAFAIRLRRHLEQEEDVLFPIARNTLEEADWQEIGAAVRNEQDAARDAAARAELRALMSSILDWASTPTQRDSLLGSEESVPADTDLLDIRQLFSHYGRIAALHGVSLRVRKGRLVALVGANGAGKTTLLRTISGVQKATGGSIWFDGRDITNLRADRRVRLGICQVPEGRQVFAPLSVADNLRLGAFTGSDEKYIAKDMRRMYEMFPILKQKSSEPAGTLSGGQQQMLAIARALMGRPRLLLLDEPSMGLAPRLVREIFRAIVELRGQSITILLVEQNANSALAIADDAYVMETGRIVISGSGGELLADERVREAYLGL